MKKKYWFLIALAYAIYFFFPSEVNAQTRFEEAVPNSVDVFTSWTTTSPQGISTYDYGGNRYYGFTYGTQNISYGLRYNFYEKSTINDKELISVHFALFTTAAYARNELPLSVYLTDNYNNIVTCSTNGWSTEINDSVGNTGTEMRSVTTISCENGHLSGNFSVVFNNRFYHYVGFYGITELSFLYSDGVSDSTILNDIKNNTKETNDLIKNDNVDGANTQGSSFFSNFSSNTHGLSGIVSSPIRLINSLSSSTCSPLSFTIPFVNSQVSLPCMSSIYSTHFPTLLSIYQLITTGLIAYKILINLFCVVKGLQDPDSSRIEVVDL